MVLKIKKELAGAQERKHNIGQQIRKAKKMIPFTFVNSSYCHEVLIRPIDQNALSSSRWSKHILHHWQLVSIHFYRRVSPCNWAPTLHKLPCPFFKLFISLGLSGLHSQKGVIRKTSKCFPQSLLASNFVWICRLIDGRNWYGGRQPSNQPRPWSWIVRWIQFDRRLS